MRDWHSGPTSTVKTISEMDLDDEHMPNPITGYARYNKMLYTNNLKSIFKKDRQVAGDELLSSSSDDDSHILMQTPQ